MSIEFNPFYHNQIVGGAIILASSLIKLLSYAPLEFLTKFESLSWMFDMAFFIACIWGSVKVFGKFPSEGDQIKGICSRETRSCYDTSSNFCRNARGKVLIAKTPL